MSQVPFATTEPDPNHTVKAFFADSFIDVSLKKYKIKKISPSFAPVNSGETKRGRNGELSNY